MTAKGASSPMNSTSLHAIQAAEPSSRNDENERTGEQTVAIQGGLRSLGEGINPVGSSGNQHDGREENGARRVCGFTLLPQMAELLLSPLILSVVAWLLAEGKGARDTCWVSFSHDGGQCRPS